MKPLLIKLKRIGRSPGFQAPAYMSHGASGMDLHAALEAPVSLAPGARELIPCGFSMEIPEGYEAQVRPRSGLAIKYGVTCLNSPGTIDHDYRGEIKVILANFGQELFAIQAGDRIAQMVIQKVERAAIELVDEIEATARGEGGFGSTGH
ncbi:MAG TPA: dUTP diphosphatase [Deltaproteobacteria bacterium]|nr:dUTP diphosphatase [Deltaproteobacteria bacterium]